MGKIKRYPQISNQLIISRMLKVLSRRSLRACTRQRNGLAMQPPSVSSVRAVSVFSNSMKVNDRKKYPTVVSRCCWKPGARKYSTLPNTAISNDSGIASALEGKSCVSCGVKLQCNDENSPGYINETAVVHERKHTLPFKRQSDLVFDEIYSRLSEEDKRLLLNDESEETPNENAEQPIENLEEVKETEKAPEDKLVNPKETRNVKYNTEEKQKYGETNDNIKTLTQTAQKTNSETPANLKCLRCYNTIHYNEYFELDPHNEAMTMSSVLSPVRVPDLENSHIFHIISANDFPLTLNVDLVAENISRSHFVINKCDLLVSSDNRNATQYFTNVINELLRSKGLQINVEGRVHLVSASKGWGMGGLHNSLPKGRKVYFIGEANVGKSSLIKGLLYYDYYLAKNRSSRRSFEEYVSKQGKKLEKKIDIPGTFVLPGTTQDILTYKINGCTVNDLPGFLCQTATGEINYGAFNILKPSWIKHLFKERATRQVAGNKVKRQQYLSIMDKDCYSLGGIFYLVGPRGSITQVAASTHEQGFRFGSLERAIETINRQPEAMEQFIGVKQGFPLDKLQRYVIPPFYGSVDLVIKGVGYVTITPTKSVKSIKKELGVDIAEEITVNDNDATQMKKHIIDVIKYNMYEFYAPADMQFVVRESIDSYLVKKTLIRRARGDSKRYFKPFIEGKKLYTSVVQVPTEVTDVGHWYYETYLKGKRIDYWSGYADSSNRRLHRDLMLMDPKDVEKEIIRVNVSNLLWDDKVV
ncbi:Gep3 protein [Saccharomycopsis crataegensis]|uniref:Genetic interactor of prohibitins 3, mitochondrial n=1 Tax=Saccharomycopsis crataegensis TaxID=43959 RepID=A0AAV5QNW3_9ASCO|nr:Gep3 protein [Saccharomycopsis crataegensis]